MLESGASERSGQTAGSALGGVLVGRGRRVGDLVVGPACADRDERVVGGAVLVVARLLVGEERVELALFRGAGDGRRERESRRVLGGPGNLLEERVVLGAEILDREVSAPLPVRSRYITELGPTTRNVSRPFGETFTCPPAPSGAVATKKSGCASRTADISGVMRSCFLPTGISL